MAPLVCADDSFDRHSFKGNTITMTSKKKIHSSITMSFLLFSAMVG
jgi:hypothetical protein